MRTLVPFVSMFFCVLGWASAGVADPHEFLFKWGSYGTGDGQFIQPNAVAANAIGDVYVGEYDGGRVQKFTSDGAYLLLKWGTAGTGDGEFNGTGGPAVGPDGSVYVNDVGNHRFQKFDADGNGIELDHDPLPFAGPFIFEPVHRPEIELQGLDVDPLFMNDLGIGDRLNELSEYLSDDG